MTLLTPQQIAEMFNIPLRNVQPLLRSPGFPPPAVDLSRKIRRWTRDSVEGWVRNQEKRNAV